MAGALSPNEIKLPVAGLDVSGDFPEVLVGMLLKAVGLFLTNQHLRPSFSPLLPLLSPQTFISLTAIELLFELLPSHHCPIKVQAVASVSLLGVELQPVDD